MIVSTSSKVLTNDRFSRPVLYFTTALYWVQGKESKLYYSTHFSGFAIIYVRVLLCKCF